MPQSLLSSARPSLLNAALRLLCVLRLKLQLPSRPGLCRLWILTLRPQSSAVPLVACSPRHRCDHRYQHHELMLLVMWRLFAIALFKSAKVFGSQGQRSQLQHRDPFIEFVERSLES